MHNALGACTYKHQFSVSCKKICRAEATKMEFVNIDLKHYNPKVGINFLYINWRTKYHYGMFAKFKYNGLCEALVSKPI